MSVIKPIASGNLLFIWFFSL